MHIDTQEQAKDWLLQLQVAAQRCKSKILEVVGDDEIGRLVINDINPGLLEREGEVDLVSMCDRIMDKGAPINRGDILNAMTYTNRCGDAMAMECDMRGVYLPANPMEWFMQSKLPIM
jgi:hypothetical protein